MRAVDELFFEHVRRAAGRAEVRAAVARLYADVAAEVEARRPVCVVSGRCCRFEEYGHRLFVTTMELAAFWYEVKGVGGLPIADLGLPIGDSGLAIGGDDAPSRAAKSHSHGTRSPQSAIGNRQSEIRDPQSAIRNPQSAPRPAGGPGGCPFQVGKLCGVHAVRPFGCRMFFCDETSTEWQNEAYERFHGRLKRLHEELGVPYWYVEWREALGKVALRPG